MCRRGFLYSVVSSSVRLNISIIKRKGTKCHLVFKRVSRYGVSLLRMRPCDLKSLPKTSRMSSVHEYFLSVSLGREQQHKLNHSVSIIRCLCELYVLEHPA